MDTSKIIIGTVGGDRYTVTAPIVKEDYGLYLKIEGLELPSTYEVDFSNSEHNGTSVTMIGNADGVLIPSQFISSGKDVFAFLYHVGADFGRTVYKFRIPNKLRPDRTNEQPTPEEQSVIDQAIAALNDAVEQTAQDVASAHEYAQASASNAESASASAQSADASREAADESEYNAQVYAENAQASATASAQSASQSAQIKDDVEGMVDDAQASANASAQSASASANSASQASGYAQSASASAQSASGYASQAQTSAQTASSKASEASTSASTASTKATESAQSASQALTYKTDAESAKTASQTAQGLAEQARDSAISAKEDAEDARDEAQALVDGISGKVEQIDSNTERIESLEDDRYKPYPTDTASGSIASFTDGADDIPLKSLVVNIDPVQDLHGQDAPYPAGGGKNKLQTTAETITSAGVTWTVNDDGSITASGTATGYSALYIGETPVTSSMGIVTISLYGVSAQSNIVVNVISLFDSSKNIIYTVSGSGYSESYTVDLSSYPDVAYIKTGIKRARNDTVTSGTIYPQIELGSTPTSWSPYENICPISGWTSVGVNQFAVNVWDEELELGSFDSQGNPTTSSTYVRSKNYIPLIPNATYYFVRPSIIAWVYYYTDTGYIEYVQLGSGVKIFTPPSNATRAKFLLAKNSYGTTYNHDISINYPSTDRDYHPYSGRSITIDLGQTVYGGHLDVLSGELTIDRAKRVLNGSEVWSVVAYQNHYRTFTPSVRDMEPLTASAVKTKIVCDTFGSGTWNNVYVGMSVVGQNGAYLGFGLDALGITTVEGIKAWLADNPITIAYPLATPIEIQLSANQINSLYGTNNLWADSGDTTAEYRADTKLYIEKLTQPEEDDMVADSAITSGQFFMVGNTLYRALANIASGATITVGTNAQRVSLADALNLVNA